MPEEWAKGYLVPLPSTRGGTGGWRGGTVNAGPLRPGRINVPGLSTCPINPARAAMARLPSAPFMCWPGPDQASTTAGLVVASSRATVRIVLADIPVMGAAHAGVLVSTRAAN